MPRRLPRLRAWPLLVVVNVALLWAPPKCRGAQPDSDRRGVELIGVAELPGTSIDAFGLADRLGDTPHNRFGGISAIEYSGADDLYYVLSDRGPNDGEALYACRWHVVELKVDRAAKSPVRFRLVGTALMRTRDDRSYVGLASAFDPHGPHADRRFDPEGIRRGPDGSLYVSDEYGPKILQFDKTGRQIREIAVPQRFLIRHPSARKDEEIANNSSGRVANAGFEGLAIGVDGTKLYALEQAPLLQDSVSSGKAKSAKRKGLNVRLLELDLASNRSRELVYRLDRPENKLSEILAVDPDQFLVIERDGESGRAARFKRIVKIDVQGAGDVSRIDSLAAKGSVDGVRPVRKSSFIDLLEPAFGLAGDSFPEKQEGLAWGPPLSDGRALLWVAVDNDFKSTVPTTFYAFAVRRDSLAQR